MLPNALRQEWHGDLGHDDGHRMRPASGRVRSLARNFLAILVVDGFSTLTLAALLEPLNRANAVHGADHFAWKLVGASGKTARAASGITIHLDEDLQSFRMDPYSRGKHFVAVCAGNDVEARIDFRTRAFLQAMQRKGATLIGLGTGAWMIADADLLADKECTIHWAKMPSFSERFRDTTVNTSRVHREGDIYTCAGEMASLELSLEIIRDRLGGAHAARLVDYFPESARWSAMSRQRFPNSLLYDAVSHPVVKAVSVMEKSIAFPKPLDEIARLAGISRRQLERLFLCYLNMAPAQYYRKIRLEWGKDLVEQTRLPIIDVAFASGFVSASHFSRAFRESFQCRPSELRAACGG